jgi:hypothetical protein
MPPEFARTVDKHFFELIGGDMQQDQNIATRKPDEDNWKHRQIGMRCRTCMFWVRKKVSDIGRLREDHGRGDMGRCRRHAPTMMGFPAVYETDWCGDHKIDENRV